jgi:hypothetical protein
MGLSRSYYRNVYQKWILHPKTITQVTRPELPLSDPFERCYVAGVTLSAGVAKLAYAADSKWEFCSFCPLRNSSQPLDPAKENDLDALEPTFG